MGQKLLIPRNLLICECILWVKTDLFLVIYLYVSVFCRSKVTCVLSGTSLTYLYVSVFCGSKVT